jgi:Raf kinase inhibitor-like YbhB/YbcL family protein
MRKTAVILMVLLACACSRPRERVTPSTGAVLLTSPAFADNGEIPRKYTCDGESASPPLRIANVPSVAKTLALIVEDPDAPGGTFTHWVVWNMKADRLLVDEGHPPDGAEEGTNDFGRRGWGAPCPPGGEHRYVFHVYALDGRVSSGPTRAELEKAMKGRVVGEGRLVGRYRRG